MVEVQILLCPYESPTTIHIDVHKSVDISQCSLFRFLRQCLHLCSQDNLYRSLYGNRVNAVGNTAVEIIYMILPVEEFVVPSWSKIKVHLSVFFFFLSVGVER